LLSLLQSETHNHCWKKWSYHSTLFRKNAVFNNYLDCVFS
jgi:hypothetical protein